MNSGCSKPELYDIYGMWHIPFWQTTWFVTLIVIFTFCLFISFVWYVLRWYRRRTDVLMPWQKALYQLNLLTIKELINKDEAKQFYFSLTSVLKTYLNELYGCGDHGKTDREVLFFLEESDFPLSLLSCMRDIFTGCTYVKYADEYALRERLVRDLGSAVMIVKQTGLSVKKQ